MNSKLVENSCKQHIIREQMWWIDLCSYTNILIGAFSAALYPVLMQISYLGKAMLFSLYNMFSYLLTRVREGEHLYRCNNI